MTLAEALAELRGTRLDDTVQPYFWSDESLVAFLNDAVRQFCIRQRALIESANVDVCTIALVPGQRLLKLHPAVISVRSLRIVNTDDGQSHRPEGKPLRWMDRRCHDWLSNEAGCAHYWVPDYQDGYLALDRPADVAATAHLTVWRMPLDTEVLEVADPTGEPVIAPHHHIDLLDWAEYRAFSSNDSEMRDAQKAAGAEGAFTAKVGRLPSAIEMRLWGVSPIRGTTPQFL